MKEINNLSNGTVTSVERPTVGELTEFSTRFVQSEPSGLAQIEGSRSFMLEGKSPVACWIEQNKEQMRELCRDYCKNSITWRCFHKLQQHKRFGRRFGDDVLNLADNEGLSRGGFYKRAKKEPRGLAEFVLYSLAWINDTDRRDG